MLQSQNLVSENFSPQHKKKVITVGNAVSDFECTATSHFNSPLSPKTNFSPLHVCCKIQPTLSAGTNKIPCKSHTASSPDLNETGCATNTQANTKAVNTNVLNFIIPRRNAERDKRQDTLLQTHILDKQWLKRN
jgi:hypothetical protein